MSVDTYVVDGLNRCGAESSGGTRCLRRTANGRRCVHHREGCPFTGCLTTFTHGHDAATSRRLRDGRDYAELRQVYVLDSGRPPGDIVVWLWEP